MNFYKTIKDRIQGKAPKGAKRAKGWRKARRTHILENSKCAICGLTSKLEVHHIIPFHVAPHLELDPRNLVTLCENKKYGINCHLLIGHLGNYRRVNTEFQTDAMVWHMKLKKD
jgi:hypothetical protein